MTTARGDELVCQELVEIVTDYLEDALPGETRNLFEEHLLECEGCQRYLDQIRTTIRLTGTLTPDVLASASRDQLLQLFRDWNRN